MKDGKFLDNIRERQQQGLSILTIATQLGVEPSEVRRALEDLAQREKPSESLSAEPTRRPMLLFDSHFVGRQREIAQLKAALGDAVSGRSRTIMLVGEPGIGKTRTAQELTSYGVAEGAQALWGRCYADQGAPAYWPWVQVVRSFLRERTPEELSSALGTGAADIAAVVPEIRGLIPNLEPPPALEPQQARFRFFDSMSGFLSRACSRQPLIIVLDNLHWADRPSLLLLEFLCQELVDCPLLLVGTYRDTELNRRHPLTQTLGELARLPSFRRMPLRGLTLDEVDRFILDRAGFPLPPELIASVHNRTEGNPLFLTQVVELLLQEEELTPKGQASSGEIAIPVGVREVIGRRLDRLSDYCNHVLTLASVIGREFELELLARLVADPPPGAEQGLSGEELLEAVDEALAAKVIEELPPSASRYQFSHVLIQDTLSQEVLAPRRARLHRRIAEALEDLYGDAAGEHALELAYHLDRAGMATDRGKLVRYSLLAGEQALATYAHEEAMAHFERGLEARGGLASDAGREMVADEEMAALLFGLGRAQVATRQRFLVQEYLTNLRLALDYYIQEGNLERAVEVAEYPVRAALGVGGGELELLSRALDLAPADSHQAGRLLSAYGLARYEETGDYAASQDALGRAAAIARTVGDQALEMRTMANAVDAHFHHLHWNELLDSVRSVLDLARYVDQPNSELIAHYYAMRVLINTGDYDGAQGHMGPVMAVAERLRHRSWMGQAVCFMGTLAQLQGRWSEAREFIEHGLTLVPQDPRFLCYRTVLEYQAGDFEQGKAYQERLLETTHRSPMGAGFG